MVDVFEVMDRLSGHYSVDRRTTLNRMRENPDPFKVLIGCLVSINIRDEVCEEILDVLFGKVNSFQDIIDMDTEELEDILYNARYRKVKAGRLKDVSRQVLSDFEGKVPDTAEELLSIKGIGPKTCNVVRAFAFGHKVIPVDTNVHRIFNRIGLIETDKVEDTESELLKVIPDKYVEDVNGIAMMHGKDVCVPVSPFCSKCVIASICEKKGVERDR